MFGVELEVVIVVVLEVVAVPVPELEEVRLVMREERVCAVAVRDVQD